MPTHAEQLMRSRYSAYALKEFDYIKQTASQQVDKNEMRQAYQNVHFENLEILETSEKGDSATVTFRATLKKQGADISFTEKSLFTKINGRWIYQYGT